MGLILDTSVLIAAERHRLDLAKLLADQGDHPVRLACITAAELLHGIHRAATSLQQSRRAQFVDDVLRIFPSVPFDLAIARRYAALWASLEKTGQMIGMHDIQIAATALDLNYRIATLNTKDFARIQGLELLDVSAYLLPLG